MRTWTPRRHDPIEELEPDLRAVQADIRPSSHIRCRMCIARVPDRRLVFMNAVPLSSEAMEALESWGTPAFLLAPTGYHTLDLAPFKTRYPNLEVIAADGCRPRIQRFVRVSGGPDSLPGTDRFRAFTLRGTRGEIAVRVGRTLCFPGDIFFNVPRAAGLDGFVFRLLGSIGGPRVTRLAKTFLVRDRRALREHLEELAASGVERLVPCHGDVVSSDAPGVLASLARAL